MARGLITSKVSNGRASEQASNVSRRLCLVVVSLEWPKVGIVIACRNERDGEAI